MTYAKIKFYTFLSNMFFPRVKNTKVMKKGPMGPLNFFQEVNIVVLTDVIVKL